MKKEPKLPSWREGMKGLTVESVKSSLFLSSLVDDDPPLLDSIELEEDIKDWAKVSVEVACILWREM